MVIKAESGEAELVLSCFYFRINLQTRTYGLLIFSWKWQKHMTSAKNPLVGGNHITAALCVLYLGSSDETKLVVCD